MATDKVTYIARVDLSICSPSMCSEVLTLKVEISSIGYLLSHKTQLVKLN